MKNITTRGIVFKNAHNLKEVYEERLPLYEKYADMTVSCSGRAIEESVGAILEALNNEDN